MSHSTGSRGPQDTTGTLASVTQLCTLMPQKESKSSSSLSFLSNQEQTKNGLSSVLCRQSSQPDCELLAIWWSPGLSVLLPSQLDLTTLP